MNNVTTFTTCKQAVAYLVAQGVHEGWAKAAINEHYNYEVDADFREKLLAEGKPCPEAGLLYGWPDGDGDGDAVPVAVTEAEIVNVWNTMREMMEERNDILMFDGEPMYDMNGDPLHAVRSADQLMQLAAMQLGEAIKKRFAKQTAVKSLNDFAADILTNEFAVELWGELELGPVDLG